MAYNRYILDGSAHYRVWQYTFAPCVSCLVDLGSLNRVTGFTLPRVWVGSKMNLFSITNNYDLSHVGAALIIPMQLSIVYYRNLPYIVFCTQYGSQIG